MAPSRETDDEKCSAAPLGRLAGRRIAFPLAATTRKFRQLLSLLSGFIRYGEREP